MILISDKKKYDEYIRMLKEVMRLQNELFSLRFNWTTRETVDVPKRKWIFGKKSVMEQNCIELANKLSIVQKKLSDLCNVETDEIDNFWWNISYGNLEMYMLHNLQEYKVRDGWRFEYKWKTMNGENQKSLLLVEEGHCSRFASEIFNNKKSDSIYSDEEQRAGNIVDDINGANFYARHTREIKNVVSDSSHYKSVFEVGKYHYKNETLIGLQWHPLQLVDADGDLPEKMQDKYSDRNALLLLAAYISGLEEIKSIQIKLFDEMFTGKTGGFAESLVWASVFTCVAKKYLIGEAGM